MTEQAFGDRVRQLEALARGDPRRYRARVAALAVLGYAYILAVLTAVLAFAFGALWAGWRGTAGATQLLLVAGVLAVDIARALWVRVSPPTGVPLTRARDGVLLRRIDEICRAVGAPRPHVVLATAELNARVAQIPRLGILGWQKNYLVIGLPLMRALSPAEFDAVLAHEFGHLAGAHGRFGAWIYRLRMSWQRLLDSLEQKKSVGTLLFRHFARRYVPYFEATSFVLARTHEYEADQAAARLCSARTAADTLCRVAIANERMHRDFWPGLWWQARASSEPPVAAYALLGAGLEAGALPQDLRRDRSPSDAEILASELAVEATLDDTHPCLRERLAALGVARETTPPGPFETSAALHYLAGRARELEAGFSRQWLDAARGPWKDQFARAEANRARLAALTALADTRPLDVNEAWEQIGCLWTDARTDAAAAALRALAERAQDFAPAQYSFGLHLLDAGDEAGLVHVERALALSREGAYDACAAARAFLEARGRGAEARRYAERMQELERWAQAARAERITIDDASELAAPALDPAALESLRAQLAADPRIARAWLVAKVLTVAPEYPVHAVAIELRHAWLRRRRTTVLVRDETARRVQLAGDWFCVALSLAGRRWRRRILAAAGAPFYVAR